MGSHSSSSHGDGRKSLLDATTFTLPNFFSFFFFLLEEAMDGLNPVDLDGLKICSSALAGFVCMCEHQKARKRAEANRVPKATPSPKKTQPQIQFRELDFNFM